MTNTDIKRIYNNYLIDSISPNFKLNKDVLFKTPVKDLLIGFCFEKSRLNKNSVYVWSFVMPLYIKKEDLSLTFGKRLSNKKNGELWHLKNNTKIDNTIQELVSLMKLEIKTFFLNVTKPQKFYEYYKNKEVKSIRIIESLVYSAIYSNYERSGIILKNFIDELKKEDIEIEWIKDVLNNALLIKEYINEQTELEKLFRNWRKETLGYLSLLSK